MSAPQKIHDLVDLFERNADTYRSPHYHEAAVRQEFINPFFKSLGWDMDNERGYDEAHKQVIHEAAIKVGGVSKAPDYCFRIGGTREFFLEAKKPAVNIDEDPAPAYQLRRYAWNASLPISILTSFERFVVYDCRRNPDQSDSPAAGRFLHLMYREFVDRWDEIAGNFSPEAINQGALKKFVESKKAKGTLPVDKAFLEDIESWRVLLAKNMALRNPKLTQRQLNFAVQMTIDRIIFLRMCEDRGIEPLSQLRGLLNGTAIYGRLLKHFRDADDRYNSGLFHFHKEKDREEDPDELTPGLTIDDHTLKEIFEELYEPRCPYEFSVLPAEILGQVYEQFLGKVIRLTAAHQAKVEDKPEVKKAGGVYYTPTYIVDYIVKQTVGKLLEGKTPKQVAKLTILDPACGSGSFLLGAYQYVLDWHRKWYMDDGTENHRKELYEGRGGFWRLTTAEKKRILLAHIYGVDIDPQAVEVTKLSLLLKVLEGESQETLETQRLLFHERALPDLASNIKCGNSLIGPDFYEGRQMEMFDDEERYHINVFDWNAAFPVIMKRGGFDAVIGNPPYIRQEGLSVFKRYFESHYEAFDGIADIYAYFMEKSLGLLREGGFYSIIVSSSFLRATYGKPLRRTLKKHAAIVRIVDFGGLPIFANAKDTYVCIPLFAKGVSQRRIEISKVDSPEIKELTEHVGANFYTIPHERLLPEAWALKSDDESGVFGKVMKAGKPLGDYVNRRLFYGIKTGLNEAFIVDTEGKRKLVAKHKGSAKLIKPVLGGEDIRRYHIRDEGRNLIVIPAGLTRQQLAKATKASIAFSEREAWKYFRDEYPAISEHLVPFAGALKKRQDQGDYWWELRPCDYYEYFDAPKIIFPDICKGPRFYFDRTGIYLANTAYCLGTDDLYLLGMLNSRLFWFAISNISIPFGTRAGQYRYRLIYQYMEKVPIRVIDFSNRADGERHGRIVQLVNQMLSLNKQLSAAKTPHEKTVLQGQIDSTDREIDRLVYELYELTEEEIKIVESANQR